MWKFLKREKNTVVSVILIDIHSVVYQKIQIMISCPILNSRFLDKCLLYALNLFGVFKLFNDFKHVNLRLFFIVFVSLKQGIQKRFQVSFIITEQFRTKTRI